MKKLFSGILFTQGLNLLIKPLYLLWIDREVQNTVPPDDYGGYFAVLNLTLIAVVLLDPGIHNFVIRSIASDRKSSKSFFISGLTNKAWLTVIYSVVVLISAWALDLPQSMWPVTFCLIFFQIAASYIQYFRSIFTALEKFKWDGILSVSERALTILLMSVVLMKFIPGFDVTVQRFSLIQAISAGTVMGLAALVVYYLFRTESGSEKINFRSFLSASWPYALLTMLMGIYSYLDGVMLNQLAPDGAVDAAEYAMGYRLYFAGFMFAQLFAAYLFPVFSRMSSEGNSYTNLAKYTFRVLLTGTLLVFSWCVVYRFEIIEGLYPDRFTSDSVTAFAILIAGLVANSFTFIFGTALTAEGRLRLLNQLAVVTVLVNVVLNAWFIPLMGASGAAVATLVSQTLFGLLCFFFCSRDGYTHRDLKGLGSVLGSFALGWGVYALLSNWTTGEWIILASTVVALGVILASGVIRLKPVIQSIRTDKK